MHNQKWDISDAQSSTDLHGCLVLDAVASTLDARASTADGLDAAASTHGLDAWPRRLDASGAWSHSTPPLDTSTLARRYSLDVCSTLGSTQARRLDARAQQKTKLFVATSKPFKIPPLSALPPPHRLQCIPYPSPVSRTAL